MTKKELGYDYGMKKNGYHYELIDGTWVVNQELKPEYEWHEQAKLIEDHLLANGYNSLETIDERFSNVAGVTIKDSGYMALATEAIKYARAGKFQAIYCENDDLYIASMYMDNEGKISDLKLDMLQGQPIGETFAWHEMTKQELGEEYGMKGMGQAYEFIDGKWVESSEKTSLEWYEQANLITDYIEANGYTKLYAIEERGATIDGSTFIDDLAGVTIKTQAFYIVIEDLFSKIS